jgi:predicted nucleic acid-binding protein
VAHVAFETVSALSLMPEPYRVAPRVVQEAIERVYPDAWLALDADAQRAALTCAVEAGLRGGALCDALVAATASAHGATLVSADRRASRAYRAIGVEVALVA